MQKNSDPKFRAIPHPQIFQSWCIEVTWPDRTTELLTGFDNQHSALEWIRLKSANWLADRIMNRPD
jgi:hypothetical protein